MKKQDVVLARVNISCHKASNVKIEMKKKKKKKKNEETSILCLYIFQSSIASFLLQNYCAGPYVFFQYRRRDRLKTCLSFFLS